MKLLNGQQLADYIKQRQGHQVAGLRQAHGVAPKLAVVMTVDNPVIDVYVRMKKKYGADIDVEVEIHKVAQDTARDLIKKLNKDPSVHGIIVQLPLEKTTETEEIVNLVAPVKDVDALGAKATLDPATPTAILWLLAGYNVDLRDKHILLIGRGRLVGAPLAKMLKASGLEVEVVGSEVKELTKTVQAADVIITATGSPAVVTSAMLKPGAVVVDAGVAGESGKTIGDLDPAVYERDDITITPAKGGVGPLTICALFENVIIAARQQQS